MKLEDECRLSYYKQIASLNEEHNIYLVQHIHDKRVYVKKILTIYNLQIFQYLQKYPISNMPQIYEVVIDEDKLIVIEEYITGTTLQQLIDENVNMKEEFVIDVICQLCIILNDLHNSHPPIVHRDIKPSNIIISPDHVVKLIDVNAAKWSINTMGQDTVLMGTAGYAAPEQYGFAVSNTKTDIYSIGILINVMLTGVSPMKQLAKKPMGNIVSRCTKMEANERYDNIWELYKVIKRFNPKNRNNNGGKSFRYPYAPPGFRDLKPVKMIFSAIGYFLIIYSCLNMEISNLAGLELWINRIAVILIIIAIIFFTGDYLGIKNIMGVKYVKNPVIRFFSNVLLGFAIFFLGVFILVICTITLH